MHRWIRFCFGRNGAVIRFEAAVRSRFSNDAGSATVEAAMLLPLILLITAAVILFCFMIYLRADFQADAVTTVERAAFSWSSSYRNPVTGSTVPDESDGLYWRTFGDAFSNVLNGGAVSVAVADAGSLLGSSNLTKRKLAQAAEGLPIGLKGSLQYIHHWNERSVQAEFSYPVQLPGFFSELLGTRTIQTVAKAPVIEPAEFIRNMDMTDTVLSQWAKAVKKLKGIHNSDSSSSDDSSQKPQSSPDTNDSFPNEAAARKKLQSFIQGKELNISTKPVYTYRHIDVLSDDGVAHEAYCGRIYYSKEKKEEIAKDVKLLQDGTVKGVVWHFFRRDNHTIGPSKNLYRALQKNGIIVVIHQ